MEGLFFNAVDDGNIDEIREYISKGVDISARDEYGRETALITAVKNG